MRKIVNTPTKGFTLIELSIVLVIIGLVVGGVLVGRDLISAAAMRAAISQVEKFNQAANTFRTKYEYLPGDIPSIPAQNFGFAARGQYAGEGDGNGIIDGIWQNSSTGSYGVGQGGGETIMFWRDLSTARLIEGSFTRATSNSVASNISGTAIADFLPKAKIGDGNYFFAFNANSLSATLPRGFNRLSLAKVTSIGVNCTSCVASSPSLTVREAYGIDSKIDDGLPTSGNAIALLITQVSGSTSDWINTASSSVAAAGSSTTCYDNNNSTSNPVTYSLTQNNGIGMNCGLAFKMQ